MAGISVTVEMLHDTRFARLGKALGIDPDLARMKCVRVYHECQHRETHVLTELEIETSAGFLGFAKAMLDAELAEQFEGEKYYVKGTRGRIEWLKSARANARNNGRKGGRPSKTRTGFVSETDPGYDHETNANSNNNSNSSSGKRGAGRNPDVIRLWSLQEELRHESIPGSRPLLATDERLKRIQDRLEAGATVEDCEHVLRVYAADAKSKPESREWFNGETNWRKDNFDRALGKPLARTGRSQEQISFHGAKGV